MSTCRTVQSFLANIRARIKIDGIQNGKQLVNCTYEDREKVMEWVKKHKCGGQTATPNDDRPGSSVVKGIHVDYSEEDVRAGIKEVANIKLKAARRFQSDHDKKDAPLHWWVITH